MAKFSKELRPVERDRFLAREEARREAGRTFEGNRYVRCKRCKFTMTEAEAAGAKIKACPQCGSEEPAEVLNLPYDPANERVSTVTLKQALQTQRVNQVPRKIG
jgi:hypothetical protein